MVIIEINTYKHVTLMKNPKIKSTDCCIVSMPVVVIHHYCYYNYYIFFSTDPISYE